MEIILNEDIIPIAYGSGSGGNFLCHWLISARENIKQLPVLSEYGNAHTNCLKDFESNWYNWRQSDLTNIRIMLRQPNYSAGKKPYFSSVHLFDAKLVNSYFKRSIRITFEEDDVNEISRAFYGKWFKSPEYKLYSRIMFTSEVDSLDYAIDSTIRDSKLFVVDNSLTNILFVSWKEIFKGDIEDLILKLSKFTDIHKDNFCKDSIIMWREKTQYCIDTFNVH